jgi:hypothetical protein
MSAHAYIQYANVPHSLIDVEPPARRRQRQAKLISIDGCPLVGQIDVLSDKRIQIEFPWPRAPELRHALGDWLVYHGIPYTVVP